MGGNIEYMYKSDDKIVLLDNKINKKVVTTREIIGNILNPNLKIFNEDGYKIRNYIELYLNQF